MSLKKKRVFIIALVAIILIICIIIFTSLRLESISKEDVKQEEIIADEDTTSPIIVLEDTYVVKTGYDKNLVEAIMSADDVDPNPTREIIGDYDVNTAGEYLLTYRITDSSGNTTTKDFTLKVKDDYTYSEEDISFEEATNLYKTDDTSLGIDVSKWQGEIDWAQVKEEGIEFAIIRVAYQNGFDGEILEDPYFQANMNGCAENSIPVSVYFSSYAKTLEEAENQAEAVCQLLSEYNYLGLTIAFDWENWTSFNKLGISLNDINNIADNFMGKCIDLGYKSMLYSSKTYLEYVWENSNNYTVWLANYVSQTSYEGLYKIWQFCQTGTINGISGYVDINVMYK